MQEEIDMYIEHTFRRYSVSAFSFRSLPLTTSYDTCNYEYDPTDYQQ